MNDFMKFDSEFLSEEKGIFVKEAIQIWEK